MKTRLELHEELCALLGSRNVYFQPPESVKIKYPAIVYSLEAPESQHADNRTYLRFKRYKVLVIAKDPEFSLGDTLQDHFPQCRAERPYPSNNLNHWPFTLFY